MQAIFCLLRASRLPLLFHRVFTCIKLAKYDLKKSLPSFPNHLFKLWIFDYPYFLLYFLHVFHPFYYLTLTKLIDRIQLSIVS